MNVEELRTMLKKYPKSMEVIVRMHSDYIIVGSCTIINGVPQVGDDWVMDSHHTMSKENCLKEKKYLYISEK